MTPLKKVLFAAIICATTFTSCLTAKKVDRQVAKQYADRQQPKKKESNLISVTTSLTGAGDQISATETKTSHLLPLFFYWSWDYKNTCTLNPQIPINTFTTTVMTYANRGLKDRIKGEKLQLIINKIPNKFAFDDKAHLIFFGYAFGWDNVSIKAENMDMVVSYILSKDNLEVKKGVIAIPNFNDKRNLGMYTSWKKATSEYLDQYDQNIATLTKLVVDQLVKEL